MANNIVIDPTYEGAKIYRMKTNKTKEEIKQWCKNKVEPEIKKMEAGGITKAKFYLLSQPANDLYVLVCVHDKQDSNWSGVGEFGDYNDGNFVQVMDQSTSSKGSLLTA